MLTDATIDNLLEQLGVKKKKWMENWAREVVRLWLSQNEVCHLDDVEVVAVELRRKRI